jgi:CheY-like chemotaxis protein
MTQNELAGIKIVWIEDDKFLGNMIQKRIAGTGAELIQVTDGAKALDAVKQHMPQAVLLDLLMPNVDGLEILKNIKADATINHIPVLVLSNLGQDKEIDLAKTLGAAKFLIKAKMGLDEIVPEIAKVVKKA